MLLVNLLQSTSCTNSNPHSGVPGQWLAVIVRQVQEVVEGSIHMVIIDQHVVPRLWAVTNKLRDVWMAQLGNAVHEIHEVTASWEAQRIKLLNDQHLKCFLMRDVRLWECSIPTIKIYLMPIIQINSQVWFNYLILVLFGITDEQLETYLDMI